MKKELWLRIRHYHFDNLVPAHLVDHVTAAFGGTDASTRSFASKLARKLGWKSGFALRAIGEYKKFVYLGVTSDFSVTPPKVLDQVWHEHLLFSRPYREFCRDILGRDFDHNPELVPLRAQTDRFEAQYDATLDLYDEEFTPNPRRTSGHSQVPAKRPCPHPASADQAHRGWRRSDNVREYAAPQPLRWH